MSGLCRWPAPQVSRSTGQDGSGKEESLKRQGGAPPCLEASARIVRSPLRKDARGVPAASRLLETDVAASSRSLTGPPRDARRRAAVTVMPRHRQWRRRALSWQSTVYKDPHQVSATVSSVPPPAITQQSTAAEIASYTASVSLLSPLLAPTPRACARDGIA